MKVSFNLKIPGKEPVMPDKVLIDTSVWIQFFRKKDSGISSRLREYLKLNQVCYAGPIAVELYQGAKSGKEMKVLNQLFETILYVEIKRSHYHHAGLISQKAAREGKIFGAIDIILATVCHDENLALFSLDNHFKEIAHYCTLSLRVG